MKVSSDTSQISRREIIELQASIAHRQGKRVGPRSLIVEVQAGNQQSYFPFFFLGWGLNNSLDKERPFYCLPYGIKVQNPATHIKTLASLYVEEIMAVQPNGPYFLGGACYAGWIAFEIAHQFQAKGYQVALLILIERSGPNSMYRKFNWFKNHALKRFNYHIINFFNLLKTEGFVACAEEFNRLLKRILNRERLLNKHSQKELQNPNNNSQFYQGNYHKQVQKTYYDAMKNYNAQVYSGKVALFFAENGGRRHFLFPKGGWEGFLIGNCQVYICPGGHSDLLTNSHYLPVLGQKLNACLNISEAEFLSSS